MLCAKTISNLIDKRLTEVIKRHIRKLCAEFSNIMCHSAYNTLSYLSSQKNSREEESFRTLFRCDFSLKGVD